MAEGAGVEQEQIKYRQMLETFITTVAELNKKYNDCLFYDIIDNEIFLCVDMCRFFGIENPLLLEKYYFISDFVYMKDREDYVKDYPQGRVVLEFPITINGDNFMLNEPYYPYYIEKKVGKTTEPIFPLKYIKSFAQQMFHRIPKLFGNIELDLMQYKMECIVNSTKKCLSNKCNNVFEFPTHRPTLCINCSSVATIEIETYTFPIQFALPRGEIKSRKYIPSPNPNRFLWDSFVDCINSVRRDELSICKKIGELPALMLQTPTLKSSQLIINRKYLPDYRIISENNDKLDEFIGQSIVSTGLSSDFHDILDHVLLGNPVIIERIKKEMFRINNTTVVPDNWELYFIGQENELKEAEFKKRVQTSTKPTEWFFHGATFNRWYPILRNGGLKVLSGTAGMANAAVYGNGVYLSNNSGVSIGYSCKSIDYSKIANIILGIVECVAGSVEEKNVHNNIWLATDHDNLCLRYLLVKRYVVNNNEDSSITSIISTHKDTIQTLNEIKSKIDSYVI